MSLASTAARGSAVTLLSQLIKLALMLASTIILARLLSPHDYGLVAMVAAVLGAGEIFRDFGLSMAALQARSLTHQQQSNLFWLNFGVGAFLTGAFCAIAHPISEFYNEPELVSIVFVLSFTFTMGGFATQFKVKINRELRFLALACIDIVPYFVAFGCALIVALTHGGYWALITQQLVTSVVMMLSAVALARWWPGLPRRTDMGSLITFGLSFSATQLVSYFTRNVDSIAIGRVWGAGNLGMYDRAYQLVILPLTQVNTPLSRVAIPVLARVREERERYVSYLRRAQLVSLYVTATVLTIFAALGQNIVAWLLGPAWQETGLLLSVLAVGAVFRSAAQISYWIFMSGGMARQQLQFYLVAQPLLALIIISGIHWGAIGVAIMHAVGYALFWATSLLWAGKKSKIKVRPFFADAIRAITFFSAPAAFLAFLAAHVVEPSGNIVQIIVGCLAACGWYAFSWLIIPSVRRDLENLWSFARIALKSK